MFICLEEQIHAVPRNRGDKAGSNSRMCTAKNLLAAAKSWYKLPPPDREVLLPYTYSKV